MKKITICILALFMVSCASNGVPRGAVAGCGDFSIIGTFTKTEARGRALWLSDSELAQRLTVDDVVTLAESLGCGQ
jgi:uncharacterized lipoprotein YmbA